MSMQSPNAHPIRLTRVQQLTLNTWRWAGVKLKRVLDPRAVPEQAALHALLASLRGIDDPLALFARHAEAYPEFSLITSVLPIERQAVLAYEILDTAFLLRWNELVADGHGPEELPPLRPRPTAARPFDSRVS
jgi:hypothetical protein